MNRLLFVALLVLVVNPGCVGGDTGSIVVDGDSLAAVETVEAVTDACAPDCEGRQCGSDGCGGVCGVCRLAVEICTEEGDCAAQSCDSSKDCPVGLVCEKSIGECVVCTGHEDCEPNSVCGTDFQCHQLVPCTSDKDCQATGEICDKEGGWCAECLGPEDCEEEEYCDEAWCVADQCIAGESVCDGNGVLECREDGGLWETTQTCSESQYCAEAGCVDFACTPGLVWCEAEVLSVCAGDGKSVESETDCAETGMHCFEDECIDTVCEPLAIFCLDNSTKGICQADGMGYEIAICPAEHYCEDSLCLPWNCTPGKAFCAGNTASMCNNSGSELTSEVDCGDDVCIQGECKKLVCSPGESWCLDDDSVGNCAQDGLSQATVYCGPQESCLDGGCEPWVCTPNQPVCSGQTATVCDPLGLSTVAGGDNCQEEGGNCVDGQCVACVPQCLGKQCGPDGCGGECGQCPGGQLCVAGSCPPPGTECVDGNDVAWDGCTEGKITEFRIGVLGEGSQETPGAIALPSGNFVIVYRGAKKDPQTGLTKSTVWADHHEPEQLQELGFLQLDGSSTSQLAVAGLSDGRYVAAMQGLAPDFPGSPWVVQIVDPEAWEKSAPVQVSEHLEGNQAQFELAGTEAGGFAVVWMDNKQDGSGWGVVARLFDGDGNPVWEELVVNTTTYVDQREPAVAVLSNGNLLVVWQSQSQDGSKDGVYGQLISADGAKVGSEIQLHAITEGDQQQAIAAQIGPDLVLTAWTSPDGNYGGVFGRTFDLAMNPLSGEQLINTWQLSSQTGPRLAFAPEQGGVAVWTSQAQDGDDYGVYGQRLDNQAGKAGVEFRVNTYTQDSQTAPSVAVFPDGSFIVAWQGQEAGGSIWDVFAQRFDKNGNRLYR